MGKGLEYLQFVVAANVAEFELSQGVVLVHWLPAVSNSLIDIKHE